MTKHECPNCHSHNILEIIITGSLTDKGIKDSFALFDLYPDIRPAESFECQDCDWKWDNPDFIKYVIGKTIVHRKTVK